MLGDEECAVLHFTFNGSFFESSVHQLSVQLFDLCPQASLFQQCLCWVSVLLHLWYLLSHISKQEYHCLEKKKSSRNLQLTCCWNHLWSLACATLWKIDFSDYALLLSCLSIMCTVRSIEEWCNGDSHGYYSFKNHPFSFFFSCVLMLRPLSKELNCISARFDLKLSLWYNVRKDFPAAPSLIFWPCSEPLFTSIEGCKKGYEIQGHINPMLLCFWFAHAWLVRALSSVVHNLTSCGNS